ncbi:DNA adenine methylase [Brevibacterium otitidis]|uniref:DNA adenine methylase n=1 Tax=Brevibacterium otitidis TaxID=53364 RepID=A0ABV5X318_9MICO|nr:DNA adenine methylase [Brevibacterium otitidis]
MKPPFPYLGSKSRLAPKIIALLPDHTHYVEPYAGSLAVLLAKPRSLAETVNDMDSNIHNLWWVIRDQPRELADALAMTPHGPEEYYRCLRDYPSTDDRVEQARRTITVLWQGISRTTRHGGMWGTYVTYTPKSVSLPAQLGRFRDRIQPVADRLADVTIENRPAVEMLDRYARAKDVCLYLDPPYLPETRSGAQYPTDMTEQDHLDLLDRVTSCTAKVVISGYPSPLYDDRLAGWQRHEFKASARGLGVTSSPRTEVVWVKPC